MQSVYVVATGKIDQVLICCADKVSELRVWNRYVEGVELRLARSDERLCRCEILWCDSHASSLDWEEFVVVVVACRDQRPEMTGLRLVMN